MQHSRSVPARFPGPRAGLAVAAGFAVAGLAAGVIRSGAGTWTDSTPVLFVYGVAVYSTVGVMILWNRPGHGIGRLALLIGLAFAAAAILDATLSVASVPGQVQSIVPGWAATIRDAGRAAAEILMGAALLLGGILLLAWFPEGHASGRTGATVHALLIVAVGLLVLGGARDALLRAIGWSSGAELVFEVAAAGAAIGVALAFVVAMVGLARRYRRTDPVRRAQIRWVMAAAGATAVTSVAVAVTGTGIVADPNFYALWDIWIVSTTLPILAIGLAITRYRLYDIDRIISRTIGWAIVTGVLIGTFAIVVFGLQAIIEPLTAGDTLAIAGSTLVVAALFAPLRSRVQQIVDRRFDRSRYDGERLLASFADRLRDEVDLATISSDARRTVDTAVRPSSVGLWLRGGSGGAT